jgi:hypothetical protein
MEIDVLTSTFGLIKLAAVIFQTIHILAVLLLVREVIRMNKVFHTSYSGCFVTGSFIYVLFMIFVLVLIALY